MFQKWFCGVGYFSVLAASNRYNNHFNLAVHRGMKTQCKISCKQNVLFIFYKSSMNNNSELDYNLGLGSTCSKLIVKLSLFVFNKIHQNPYSVSNITRQLGLGVLRRLHNSLLGHLNGFPCLIWFYLLWFWTRNSLNYSHRRRFAESGQLPNSFFEQLTR